MRKRASFAIATAVAIVACTASTEPAEDPELITDLPGVGLVTFKVAIRTLEAIEVTKQFAEKGDAGAQVVIGTYYDIGHILVEDDVQALKWYYLAVAQGSDMLESVRDLESNMSPGEIAEAQRLAREWSAARDQPVGGLVGQAAKVAAVRGLP